MRQVLIFGGTSEGRMLSEYLDKRQLRHTVCVATDYGEEVMEHTEYVCRSVRDDWMCRRWKR